MKRLNRALVIAVLALSPLAGHAAVDNQRAATLPAMGTSTLASGGNSPARDATFDSEPGKDAPEQTDRYTRHADHRLERKVRQALFHGKVDVTHVSILARNGKVTLIGGVPSQAMIPTAASIAMHVAGVRSVDNELIRRPEGN